MTRYEARVTSCYNRWASVVGCQLSVDCILINWPLTTDH
jgi:hypothetical protein